MMSLPVGSFLSEWVKTWGVTTNDLITVECVLFRI